MIIGGDFEIAAGIDRCFLFGKEAAFGAEGGFEGSIVGAEEISAFFNSFALITGWEVG